MDAKTPSDRSTLRWEVGPITKVMSGNHTTWQFDLRISGRPPYLLMTFSDPQTARTEHAAFQKLVARSSAITPLIVV